MILNGIPKFSERVTDEQYDLLTRKNTDPKSGHCKQVAIILPKKYNEIRAALITHELEWIEHWGRPAKLELKWSTRELLYVGKTNITQST